MIKELIFGKTVIPWLGKGMDAMAARQKATAQNIANAQTPGYQRKVVLFEDELRKTIRRQGQERLLCTQPEHLPAKSDFNRIRPKTTVADERRDGPGSEELVIEREMSNLAETQLQFEAEARLAQTQFEMLRMAIRGSR